MLFPKYFIFLKKEKILQYSFLHFSLEVFLKTQTKRHAIMVCVGKLSFSAEGKQS